MQLDDDDGGVVSGGTDVMVSLVCMAYVGGHSRDERL